MQAGTNGVAYHKAGETGFTALTTITFCLRLQGRRDTQPNDTLLNGKVTTLHLCSTACSPLG
jgi:hypothetical protein